MIRKRRKTYYVGCRICELGIKLEINRIWQFSGKFRRFLIFKLVPNKKLYMYIVLINYLFISL